MELLEQHIGSAPVAVVDLEMTGLDPQHDRVCEIAVVRAEGGRIVASYQTLVRPPVPMSKGAIKVTGLTNEQLESAPVFADVADQVRAVLDGAVMVAHNAPFDLAYLHREYEAMGSSLPPPVTVDTLEMSRRLFAFSKNNLVAVCQKFGIQAAPSHRALDDAHACHQVYRHMCELLDPHGTVTIGELLDLLGALAPNSPLRLRQKRLIREAFAAKTTLFIDYQSSDHPLRGLVHREIAIWALKLPYMQAWCYLRQGERVFRLDRIRRLGPGEREYEIPDFELRI